MSELKTLTGPAARAGLRHIADAAEIARVLAPEEPVFCFSAAALEARVARFLNGFRGEVAYAVKANPSRDMLAVAAASGIAVFDVASVPEMEAVRAVRPDAVLHYHNPVKSRAEIAAALTAHGCRRFAADHVDEVRKIAEVAGTTAGIEIAVRFRLGRHGGSAHDFSSKFGLPVDGAARLLAEVAGLGFTPVLTFHPGSQCRDPEAWVRHIEAAADIARAAGVTLAALNVGGGFPARYRDGGEPALETIFGRIAEAAARAFRGRAPKLECEPGRALCAPALSLLTRVKAVRRDMGEAFINDGLYGALMEAGQSAAVMPAYRVIRAGRVYTGATVPMTVFGPTCDPLDVLPVKLDLPADVSEDDFIEFGGIGAYSTALVTRFNGYGVTETIAVDETFAG